MQPVWVLSVDLQTKTATFQSGLSDAAKSARGAFTDIKQGAGDMGRATSGNMMEARHGVMLLGEEFGIHLPRALTSFIASIGPVGAAMEAAFPFLAIAVGATLLIEHLVKMHEAGEKLTQDQERLGNAVTVAFNTLDSKLIQAQIKSDELRNDHLGALKGQLELIDRASMEELVKSFETVAKAADVVFKNLEGSWYKIGIGSGGAKNALDNFQLSYQTLMDKGDEEGAKGLLRGTLAQAVKVQAAFGDLIKMGNGDAPGADPNHANYAKAVEARKILSAAGVSGTREELTAQNALVNALEAQVGIQERAAAIKKLDSENATKTVGNAAATQTAAGQKEAADSALRIGQLVLTADRANAQAELSIHRATIAERLQSDLEFTARETQLKVTANQAEIAALDKGGKDYHNQLKALHNKALEITQQAATQEAELRSKATIAGDALDIQNLEQSEREKIEATQRASTQRLAAINSAIQAEEAKGLQDTNFYRDLLRQRIDATRQMDEDTAKLNEQAGKEEADNIIRTGQLDIAALRQRWAVEDSARIVTYALRAAEETEAANQEYSVKMRAYAQELSALDKNGKDYANRLKAIRDKERQATQQHENEITAIETQAEIDRNERIKQAEERARDATAQNLTQTLMGHQSFANMMNSLGDQVATGMIQNALKSMLAADMTKEKEAAQAARKAFNYGLDLGGPVAGMILGPVFGAAAFASVMAFERGGIVPGVGRGDIVPAMLEPGEPVLPKNMGERLNRAMSDEPQGNRTVVHVRPTYHIQALDGGGVQAVLDKHTTILQRHFENSLRKLNR